MCDNYIIRYNLIKFGGLRRSHIYNKQKSQRGITRFLKQQGHDRNTANNSKPYDDTPKCFHRNNDLSNSDEYILRITFHVVLKSYEYITQ